MMHRVHLLIACALLTFLGPQQGVAEDASKKEVKIGFGVLLENAEPTAGTVICKIDQTCRLLEQESPKLVIDLKVTYQNDSWVSEMQVNCERDCSLANGRSIMKFQEQRELDLFGDKPAIFTLLVSKPRKTVGKILLTYPDM